MDIIYKLPKLKRYAHLIIGLGIIIVISSCSAAAATESPAEVAAPQAQVVLKVSGSGGTTPIVAALAPIFEAATPGYRIEPLTGSGTGGGVKGVLSGGLDVAAMGRAPKEEEAAQLEFYSFGYGSEIPVAHGDIAISDLTSAQLTAIFAGEITNWSEVGGPDQPIIVYTRRSDSTHTKMIREAFFGEASFIETAQALPGMGDMISAVEGTPGSIGYVNWPTAVAKESYLTPIAVNGLTFDASAYSAKLEIGIAYLPDREADVQPLLEWLDSEQGQSMLREFGVVSTSN